MDAVGRYDSVSRSYLSSCNPEIDSGPNSSSGTENRVSNRSKYVPSRIANRRRRATRLFAVPGGPSSNRCSPDSAASSPRRTARSRSTSPEVKWSRILRSLSTSGRVLAMPLPTSSLFVASPAFSSSVSSLVSTLTCPPIVLRQRGTQFIALSPVPRRDATCSLTPTGLLGPYERRSAQKRGCFLRRCDSNGRRFVPAFNYSARGIADALPP